MWSCLTGGWAEEKSKPYVVVGGPLDGGGFVRHAESGLRHAVSNGYWCVAGDPTGTGIGVSIRPLNPEYWQCCR